MKKITHIKGELHCECTKWSKEIGEMRWVIISVSPLNIYLISRLNWSKTDSILYLFSMCSDINRCIGLNTCAKHTFILLNQTHFYLTSPLRLLNWYDCFLVILLKWIMAKLVWNSTWMCPSLLRGYVVDHLKEQYTTQEYRCRHFLISSLQIDLCCIIMRTNKKCYLWGNVQMDSISAAETCMNKFLIL